MFVGYIDDNELEQTNDEVYETVKENDESENIKDLDEEIDELNEENSVVDECDNIDCSKESEADFSEPHEGTNEVFPDQFDSNDSNGEKPRKNRTLMIVAIALIAVLLAGFGYITLTRDTGVPGIEEDMYKYGMDVVKLIDSGKLGTTEIAKTGDAKAALGDEDFAKLEAFDTKLNGYTEAPSAETQVFATLVYTAINTSMSEGYFLYLDEQAQSDPSNALFADLDVSNLKKIADVYGEITDDILKAVNTKNVDKMNEFQNSPTFTEKIQPYSEFLDTLSARLQAEDSAATE